MLVVTDSEIATGNREVSDRGMFESRSLEGSCIGASKGLKPLPGSCGFLQSSSYSISDSVQ